MRQRIFVNGIAFWSPQLPSWEHARAACNGDYTPPTTAAARPTPTLLAPTERRRAPDSVAVALEVAARACEQAELDPATLCSVFASTHGDLAVTDSVCETLAKTPLLTSPTKFHNSVHNAAAGYWTIGVQCLRPYTAVSAWHFTFAAALLEAATQAVVQQEPVLYVAYDIAARGPLGTMAQSAGLLGTALVLAPGPSNTTIAQLDWFTRHNAALTATASDSPLTAVLAGNAMHGCLPLLEALAAGSHRNLSLAVSAQLELVLELRPHNGEYTRTP